MKRFLVAALLVMSAVCTSRAQATHSVSLTCTAANDFLSGDSYNMYRATVAGGPYAKINTTSIAACAFTDSGLNVGTYYYVATHVSGTAESVFSNEAKAVILPRAPSALVATPN